MAPKFAPSSNSSSRISCLTISTTLRGPEDRSRFTLRITGSSGAAGSFMNGELRTSGERLPRSSAETSRAEFRAPQSVSTEITKQASRSPQRPLRATSTAERGTQFTTDAVNKQIKAIGRRAWIAVLCRSRTSTAGRRKSAETVPACRTAW
jgi:hypothetical protein